MIVFFSNWLLFVILPSRKTKHYFPSVALPLLCILQLFCSYMRYNKHAWITPGANMVEQIEIHLNSMYNSIFDQLRGNPHYHSSTSACRIWRSCTSTPPPDSHYREPNQTNDVVIFQNEHKDPVPLYLLIWHGAPGLLYTNAVERWSGGAVGQ